jgi:hypothetical protein
VHSGQAHSGLLLPSRLVTPPSGRRSSSRGRCRGISRAASRRFREPLTSTHCTLNDSPICCSPDAVGIAASRPHPVPESWRQADAERYASLTQSSSTAMTKARDTAAAACRFEFRDANAQCFCLIPVLNATIASSMFRSRARARAVANRGCSATQLAGGNTSLPAIVRSERRQSNDCQVLAVGAIGSC